MAEVPREYPDFRIGADDSNGYVWFIEDIYSYAIKEEYWELYGTGVSGQVYLFLTWAGEFTVSFQDGMYGIGDPETPPAILTEPAASVIWEDPGPAGVRYEITPIAAVLNREVYE